jgi:ABC-type transport system substrate-binding protein
MRAATIVTLALALTLAGACQQKSESASTASVPSSAPAPSAQPSLSPEQLGELGAQIQKNPDHAAELLTQHGFTPETFEKAIRDTTENPEASRRYAAAYKRASA